MTPWIVSTGELALDVKPPPSPWIVLLGTPLLPWEWELPARSGRRPWETRLTDRCGGTRDGVTTPTFEAGPRAESDADHGHSHADGPSLPRSLRQDPLGTVGRPSTRLRPADLRQLLVAGMAGGCSDSKRRIQELRPATTTFVDCEVTKWMTRYSRSATWCPKQPGVARATDRAGDHPPASPSLTSRIGKTLSRSPAAAPYAGPLPD